MEALQRIIQTGLVFEHAEEQVAKQKGLQSLGEKLSSAIHEAVLEGGEPARTAADLLHGTWLGHPLHAVLTDLTVGAWSLGLLFDWIGRLSGSRDFTRAADLLTTTGVLSAIPTAVSGLTDFSAIKQDAASTATVHAMTNTVGLGLYIWSMRERSRGNRGRALALSSIAYSAIGLSAWLGGELVYKYKVGINHGEEFDEIQKWTPVLAASSLVKGNRRCVELNGKKVLLYRDGKTIFAIGAVCSHAGGPLEEGRIDGSFVECPWHNSIFDLRSGGIKHGPATKPQAAFETRISAGQIEIRRL